MPVDFAFQKVCVPNRYGAHNTTVVLNDLNFLFLESYARWRRRKMYFHNQFLPNGKWCLNSITSQAQLCEGHCLVATATAAATTFNENEQNHYLGTEAAMQCELHPICSYRGLFWDILNTELENKYPVVAVGKEESPGFICYPEENQRVVLTLKFALLKFVARRSCLGWLNNKWHHYPGSKTTAWLWWSYCASVCSHQFRSSSLPG